MSRDYITPRELNITFPQFKLICRYYIHCSGQCTFPEGLKKWQKHDPDCKIRKCPVWKRWIKRNTKIFKNKLSNICYNSTIK